MTDLDLEAIKAQAKGLEAAMDNDTADYDPDVWEMCVDLQRLAEEVERLRGRLAITDDMIERAALAIAEVDEWPTNEELGGGPTGTRDDEFRDEYIDMARAALEAALGEI